MKVGELFVNLLLKGTDETDKGLKKIKSNFDELRDGAIKAKLAMVAVAIAIERAIGASSQRGMELKKFAVVTGESTKELQNWQHAGMKYDITADKMAQSISAVQDNMTAMLRGKGGSAGLGFFGQAGVEFDPEKMNKAFYVLKKYSEFAKSKLVPKNVKKDILKDAGFDNDMQAFLEMVVYEKDKAADSDILTEDEINRLAEMNGMWKEMWFTLQTIMDKLVAALGPTLVKGVRDAFRLISDFLKFILRVINKFESLKMIVLTLGVLFAAWTGPLGLLSTIIAGIITLFAQIQRWREGKENIFSTGANIRKSAFGGAEGTEARAGKFGLVSSLISSALKSPPGGSGGVQDNKVINMNNYISGSQHPHQVGKEIQKEVGKAFRSSHSLNQQTGK